MKKKIINLTIFQDVKGLCFMKCPTCREDILITTDKWCKCKNVYKNHIKRVFKLKGDKRTKEGFSQVIGARVKDFRRTTLKELEVKKWKKKKNQKKLKNQKRKTISTKKKLWKS